MTDSTRKSSSSPPSLQPLEPIILNGDLENMLGDGDLACFDPSVLQSHSTSVDDDDSRFLDRFYLHHHHHQQTSSASDSSPPSSKYHHSNPVSISTSRKRPASSINFDISNNSSSSPSSDVHSDSPEGSSHSSSVGSPGTDRPGPGPGLGSGSGSVTASSLAAAHSRDRSDLTVMSFTREEQSNDFSPSRFRTDDWLDFGKYSSPVGDVLDSGLDMHDDVLDLEASNRVMDAAFDFESAAGVVSSHPNGSGPHKMVDGVNPPPHSQPETALNAHSHSLNLPTVSPNGISSSHSKPFRSKTSPRIDSPNVFNTITEDRPTDQWNIRSPTSEMEENLGNVHMTGSSPANSAFANLDYSFGSGADRIASFSAGSSAPQPNIPLTTTATTTSTTVLASSNHDLSNSLPPVLIVHPTSQKSRVETQIPIRLTLCSLPQGVKKLRLPRHSVSKLKFFAKPDTPRCAEILELHANVVCTSTMQDASKLENALARARGDPSSQQSESDSPLSGGDVKICPNCIKRERKRANRKKQRKPEEEEIFQRDEEKRIVVFNTTELRDWVEPPRTPGSEHLPPGTMQVELPMRIACYCRHQSEKMGFQVIFTIKDHEDNVVAQSITNSIMITDDHKTHATAASQSSPSVTQDQFNMPNANAFAAGSQMDVSAATSPYSNPFRLSHSATDLASMRQPSLFSHPSQFPNNRSINRVPNGVAFPASVSRQSSVATSVSNAGTRHTSPVDRQGPSSKRRKHSGQGRIPPELTMTRLNGSHSASPSAVPDNQLKPSDRGFAMQPTTPSLSANISPAPQLAGDSLLMNQLTDTLSREMIATPTSTHTSRPASPTSSRPLDTRFSTAAAAALTGNQMFGLNPPNSLTRIPPAMIHKLVPSEGSTTGGSEVTILGSGFFPGMEVVFGDTLATTTTFWGDKCLNCLTPPAIQPGRVQVTFKHEHPLMGGVPPPPQSMVPKQMIFFTYVDDRELQMYRLALGILGQKLGNPADAYQTAQQIMGSDTSGLWNLPNGYGSGSQHGGGGQQHSGSYQNMSRGTSSTAESRTNDLDIKMSEYLKFFALEFTDDGQAISTDADSEELLSTKSLSGGQTLLHLAASLRLVHFTNGLLLRGADPNAKDNNENTPLHLAALSGDLHIVNRLRLGGANIHVSNKADLVPADLAVTSDIYQALLTDRRKRRTRSVSSSSVSYTQSRRLSLDSSWCPSVSDNSGATTSDSSEDQSEDVSDSGSDDRSSSDETQSNAGSTDGRASLYAWRDQLVAQINAFQQSVNRAFPNLAHLPPLPNLTDYHNHSMVKRITSLVPTNPSTIVKDSWDRLTGHTTNTTPATEDPPQQQSPAPPAYEDLYPQEDNKMSQDEFDIKQSSILEAAIDTAADAHFEAAESSSASKSLRASSSSSSSAKDSTSVKDVPDLRVARTNIPREHREHLRMTHEHKLKRIGSDLNLFLVWIPLFVVVMAAMLRNFIPDAWDVVVETYQAVKGYYTASPSIGNQVAQRLAT